jgi:ferritin-like protein
MWQNVFVLKESGLRMDDILGKVVKALELQASFYYNMQQVSLVLSRGMKKEMERLPS